MQQRVCLNVAYSTEENGSEPARTKSVQNGRLTEKRRGWNSEKNYEQQSGEECERFHDKNHKSAATTD